MADRLLLANWKMNLSQTAALALTKEYLAGFDNRQKVELVLCPSFTALAAVGDLLKNSPLKLGAQDLFWEERGAFTGEVSAEQLMELGVKYVIVGHSERRGLLGENNLMVHQKTKAALTAGLIPVICVGETFEQRQEKQQDYQIIKQVTAALAGIELSAQQSVVVAYEPVWVIGTGQAVRPAEAAHTAKVIRQTLVDLFPLEQVKNNFKIIYGGSVNQDNIAGFLTEEILSGFLVGGAGLQAQSFLNLVNQL